MATATTTTDNPRAKEDESDVENWCVIWLDANASTEINQNEEEQLRPIVKHLKTFQDKASCRKYLKEQSKADKLKLIVSGKLGQQIVPAVHDLEQIASIYVYCIDCQNHIQWTKSHPKVKAVIDSFDQLLSEMKADRKNPTTVQYSLTIDDTGRTTGHLNAQSVYFQRLIDCFLELEYSLEDRNEFLDVYGDLDDEGKCKEIEEFRKSYSPQSAIKRYTQATFFYKDLNNAFRTMNYRTIFLYRSYIADIYRQLKENQSTTPLKVYRGQFMSKSEIKKLQRCRGQLISVGSFFSTSLHKETAQAFKSDKATDTLEPLLFEIDADPKMATTTPFAKISELSAFHQESEVLFMLGSIFRLDSIAPNDDGSGWNMKMTLCSENEHAFKDDLEYMKKQADNRQTNYQILGDLLFILREFNSARLCFTRHLDKLPENDTQRLKLYEDLEKLEAQAGFHNEGMKWQRKARAFQDQNPSTSIPSNTATTTTHIILPSIPSDGEWENAGFSVAGGHDRGNGKNQLDLPMGLCIDDDDDNDDQTIFIADQSNHRIIQCKRGETNGVVVAGGNGEGGDDNQLCNPSDVLIDKQSNCLLICDRGNRRVVRWPRYTGIAKGETLINNIDCRGLAMDNQGNLYVSDIENHEVRRYEIHRGDTKGILVAGGNGKGGDKNQLKYPTCIFVDRQQSVYLSDKGNHRVMKWKKGANKGIVVAGGKGYGASQHQLWSPRGIIVDMLGNLYVAEFGDDRVTYWSVGAKEGIVIAGGNDEGAAANQFDGPNGLCFDKRGRLYVVDNRNHRVQCFSLLPSIPSDGEWQERGFTVAGGHDGGNGKNQLDLPLGLSIDDDDDNDDQTIFIADQANHRIIQCKRGENNRVVVAGGNGEGNGDNQLCNPSDVLIDKQSNCLLVCDHGNRRVVR